MRHNHFELIRAEGTELFTIERNEIDGTFVGKVYHPISGQTIEVFTSDSEREIHKKLINWVYCK